MCTNSTRNVSKAKCHWKLVEEVEEREMRRHEGAKDEQNGVWEQGPGQCARGGGRGVGREGRAAANQQLEIQMCHRGSMEATPAESATWPAFVDRRAAHPVGW